MPSLRPCRVRVELDSVKGFPEGFLEIAEGLPVNVRRGCKELGYDAPEGDLGHLLCPSPASDVECA